jgi:hypothetical protein
MNIKTCTKCKESKSLDEFSKGRSLFDKSSRCKNCVRAYRQIWKHINIDAISKKNKEWYSNNKDRKKQYCAEYNSANKDAVRRINKIWASKNKFKLSKKTYECHRRRIKSDLNYKLRIACRNRIYNALAGKSKEIRTIELLGCTIIELKTHLESLFQPGMSWKNWSLHGWHIDHIRPLSSFDLSNRDQLLKACHYTNLQPLWAKDNLSKGNKVQSVVSNEENIHVELV